MTTDFDLIGHDLTIAFSQRLEARRRTHSQGSHRPRGGRGHRCLLRRGDRKRHRR